jgi:hypothetical protein
MVECTFTPRIKHRYPTHVKPRPSEEKDKTAIFMGYTGKRDVPSVLRHYWTKFAASAKTCTITGGRAIVKACIMELGSRTGEPFEDNVFQAKFKNVSCKNDLATREQLQSIIGEMTNKRKPEPV